MSFFIIVNKDLGPSLMAEFGLAFYNVVKYKKMS